MKKIILVSLAYLSTMAAHAQMKAAELWGQAERMYGKNWVKSAETLSKEVKFDKNNALTYTEIIDCGDKTKDELHLLLGDWALRTFDDTSDIVQSATPQGSTFICRGNCFGIAWHEGVYNAYVVSIKPVVKVEIKDGKLRVTCSVHQYDIDRYEGGLVLFSSTPSIHKKWDISQTYPFVAKDSHKTTSSKAFVMTHAYAHAIIDQIKHTIATGASDNEDDDW